MDYIIENQIDFFILTETWLRADDDVIFRKLTPDGYRIIVCNREDQIGGGLAFVHRSDIESNLVSSGRYNSYEHVELYLPNGTQSVRILAVYRAQYSKSHKVSTSVFFHEFSDHLEKLLLKHGRLLICGDFNIHVDVTDDTDAENLKVF